VKFRHHEALPLERAPGQLTCLGEQAATSLLARRFLDGFVLTYLPGIHRFSPVRIEQAKERNEWRGQRW